MIFVDTSALYALLDSGDASHARARATWSRVREPRIPLVSTNYVVVELTAVVQARLGHSAVRDLHTSLLPLIEMHFVAQSLHAAAIELLLGEQRRRLSLVDCTSFLFMRRHSIASAFAYDRDFKDFGFTLV